MNDFYDSIAEFREEALVYLDEEKMEEFDQKLCDLVRGIA